MASVAKPSSGDTPGLAKNSHEGAPGPSERAAPQTNRCTRLVWYERYERMEEAIAREKQIKGGSRAKKLALIDAMNPDWADLYDSLAQQRRAIYCTARRLLLGMTHDLARRLDGFATLAMTGCALHAQCNATILFACRA
jgi:putative endonuclease